MYPGEIWGLFHLYGLMIALGILACFGVLFYYGKKKKIQESFIDFVFYNGILSIVVGFGAAALFQATYDYIDNPANGFKLDSGITFIGGLIGGIVTFLITYWFFRKRFKARLVDIVSMAPCCILIAHAFGRVGCFFAGCCYGKETSGVLGVQFPHLLNPVYPTQLYEAVFLFLLFGVCFLLLMKKDFKHNLSVYLVAYGIFRFLIEYLRGDERGSLFGGISPSQFWSILMVGAGVGVYFLMNFFVKKRAVELANAPTMQAEETEEIENVEDKVEKVENINETENVEEKGENK